MLRVSWWTTDGNARAVKVQYVYVYKNGVECYPAPGHTAFRISDEEHDGRIIIDEVNE